MNSPIDTTQTETTYTELWGTPTKIGNDWGIRLAVHSDPKDGAVAQVRSRKGSRWFVRLDRFHKEENAQLIFTTTAIPRNEQLLCVFGRAPAPTPVEAASEPETPPESLYNAFLAKAEEFSTPEILGALERLAYILEARAADKICKEPVSLKVQPEPEPEPEVTIVEPEPEPEPEPKPQPTLLERMGLDELPF